MMYWLAEGKRASDRFWGYSININKSIAKTFKFL